MMNPPPQIPQVAQLVDIMNTPMSDILLAPLNELQALSQTLFQSLGPPQSRPPPPPSTSAFAAVDAKLASSVHLSRFHQVKQRKIESLKDELLDLDTQWRNIVQELEAGKRELEAIVTEGEERIKATEQASAGELCIACTTLVDPECCSCNTVS